MTTETTASLLPRTFFIQIRSPFDINMSTLFHIYIHADSRQAALEWTQRIFPGLSYGEMLRRWANPSGRVTVGNSDPTIITDCDNFGKPPARGRLATDRVVEPGANRRSPAQVRESLDRTLEKLREAKRDLRESFKYWLKEYEQVPTEHRYARLAGVKQSAENAKLWLRNLEQEMHVLPEDAELVMPDARHVVAFPAMAAA